MPPRSDVYALDVRGSRVLVCRAVVGLTGEGADTRTCWIDIAGEGTWKGHADGEFSLTVDSFRSCMADAEKRGTPISVDYEHASLYPSGGPTPAAGWVRELAVKGGRLCALVEFTERAAEMIRAGEYRYCSGVFAFDKPDRQSGEVWPCVLDSIALTNRPFIDGQQPIALTANHTARRALSGGSMAKITRAALLEALDKIEGEEFSAEQIEALAEALAKMAEASDPKAAEKAEEPAPLADAKPKAEDEEKAEEPALSVAGGISQAAAQTDYKPAAEEPMPDPAADAGAMVAEKLMAATGMDAAALMAALDANMDAVVAALMGSGPMPAALTDSNVVKALSETLAATKQRLAKYEAQEKAARDRALDAEVDALVQAGKVLPAHRSTWRALAQSSPAQFRTLSETLPVVVPTGREASATPGPKSEPTGLDESVIDMTDPRVVALSEAMDRFGVKDAAIRARRIREALAKNTHRSAG